MVRIAVQASSGAARFSVAVQAESVERALEIAKKQDLGRNSEVTLPINSEVFFTAEPIAVSGSARPGRSAAKPGGRGARLCRIRLSNGPESGHVEAGA
jgi:hypothetical protein